MSPIVTKTPRRGFYRRMVSSTELTSQIGGDTPRIFAKKSMTSAKEETPYIVYKLGNNTAEEVSETTDFDRQYLQVWVHDFHDGTIADYQKIDGIITILRAIFKNFSDPENGILTVRYLETSQDLDDDTLNTVFKYVRFQIVTEEK